ncbi:hypothetical protein PAPHI01_1731 [Pancytospora philotis]|nr:hypothetical protein PAPHI01_1731 [Pancytospora philotis]
MCGVIGSMQAVEVVKVVVARAAGEVPAAKLLLYNGFSNTSHAIPIRAARCCVCTGERDENTLDAPPAVACSGVVSPDSSVPTVSWAAVLSDPSGFFLVDIRSQPHFQMFRAKGAVNIPNVEQALDTLRGTGKRVAISCYRGNSSRRAVSLLAQHGIDAVSVEGGIEELKRLLQFETLE